MTNAAALHSERWVSTRVHSGGGGIEISVELLGQLGDGGLVPELDGHGEGERGEVPEGASGSTRMEPKRASVEGEQGAYWYPCGCVTVLSDTRPLIADDSRNRAALTR